LAGAAQVAQVEAEVATAAAGVEELEVQTAQTVDSVDSGAAGVEELEVQTAQLEP